MLVCLFFTLLYIPRSQQSLTQCQLTGQKIGINQYMDSVSMRETWKPKYGSLYHKGELLNPGIRMPFKCKYLNNNTKYLLIQSQVILNQQIFYAYYPIQVKKSNQYYSNDYSYLNNSKAQRLAKIQLEGGYISPSRITLSHGPVYYYDIQNNSERDFTKLKLFQCQVNLSFYTNEQQNWLKEHIKNNLPFQCTKIQWSNIKIKLSTILLIINLLMTVYI